MSEPIFFTTIQFSRADQNVFDTIRQSGGSRHGWQSRKVSVTVCMMKRSNQSIAALTSSVSKTKRSLAFREGDEVLVDFPNDFKYYGVVVDVESDEEICLVRYGDRTEKWASFDDVKKLTPYFKIKAELAREKNPVKSLSKPLKSRTKPKPVKLETLLESRDFLLVSDRVFKAPPNKPFRFETLTWDDNHLKMDEER